MRRLREIVDGRNAIVEGLDEDRLRSVNAARFKTRSFEEIIIIIKTVVFIREVEEDQQLNEMMQNLGESPTMHQSDILQLFPEMLPLCAGQE